MSKRYTVEFNAKITPVKPLNDEFTLCKCYTMALDKNRNMSYISKDAADAALPTLYNIPVIGHMTVDNDGNYHMGGHDMTLATDTDGNLMFKSLCVPYGVVPQQDGVHYEEIQEPNGDVKTYLVSDVILWTGRFPELYEAIFDDKTYFGQSMEINVNKYELLEEDKNYTNITSYAYSALCLLGKSENPDMHVEPCFPMARIEPYEFSLDDNFSELMLQFKNELTQCFEANTGKGGETMDEINTLEQFETVSEENNTPDTESVPVDVNEPATPDETNFSNENTVTEGSDDTHSEGEAVVVTFSSTYKEKREALSEALPFVENRNSNGDIIYYVNYWVCDFDDACVYVERNEWSEKDGYSETKGKFAYTFDEESRTASITSEFEEMLVKWLTKEEADQIDAMRNHYEELIEYRKSRELADRNAEYDRAISEFEDLAGNEEFDVVCENKYSYNTVEDLKNACYIIRGKFSILAPKPKTNSEPVIPVGQPSANEGTIRERFHAKYGSR